MRAAPSRDHGRGVPWGERPALFVDRDRPETRCRPCRADQNEKHCLDASLSTCWPPLARARCWSPPRMPLDSSTAPRSSRERASRSRASRIADRPAIHEEAASEWRGSPAWPQFQAATAEPAAAVGPRAPAGAPDGGGPAAGGVAESRDTDQKPVAGQPPTAGVLRRLRDR